MTMPLDVRQCIRRMDADGAGPTEIARALGISRNTVAKYASMEDLSPAPPLAPERAKPAIDPFAGWVSKVLSDDLSAPRKQRHTARRIYDRLVEEEGYAGSYATVCRFVREWRLAQRQSPGDGYLELDWAPGTMQVDYGNFVATVAGRSLELKMLAVTLPQSNSRYCVAMRCEKAECFCEGLVEVFELVGRVPRVMVLDNATEAGRMLFGKVTESRLFSQLKAHYRFESRFCNPHSGNEKGSVENAVGFLRRNLLVPVPSVASVDELNARLRVGCERINSTSRNKFREPTTKAFPADFAAMMSLPGVRFDSVRWLGARSDKRGYVRVDGNSYCAGPAWHDRDLVVGVRANSVDILADRNRRVATLPRCWGEGELVRNPLSLVPAIVARPRAFGESTIRRDMPEDLVAAIDRCDRPQVRRALRAIERAAATSGFGAACEAARRIFGGGRVPDDASCDMLARRVAAGERDGGGVDLTAYDRLVGEGARLRAV